MVTSMKKMTETIYYMVTSSKNKEENTIYMMSSVTETIFLMTVVTALTLEAEMTVMTVTVATENNSSNCYIEQQLTSRENVNVMYSLITARR
jgi:hypothetical protein